MERSCGAKSLSLAILLLLALSCGGHSKVLPPGSTVQATAQVLVSPASPSQAVSERLFELTDDGLYEITDVYSIFKSKRTLVIAPPGKSSIYDAAVSPDGTDVALSIQGPPEQTEQGYSFGVDLYVARDGGDPAEVAAHERIGETLSRPNWLPGTNKIIFDDFGRDQTGGAELHIDEVDLDSGERQRLIENAAEPSLSPDGSQLAYVDYGTTGVAEVIRILDLATGQSRPLLPENQIMANVANIAWAPDGGRLVFAASDPVSLMAPGGGGAGRWSAMLHPTLRDVWYANLDGTGLRRITDIADSTLSLAWSADNAHVYAVGDTGFWSVDTTNGELELLDDPVYGGRVQTLFLSNQAIVIGLGAC